VKQKNGLLTLETLVLFADQVLDRHLDVLECDVGRTARPHTLTVHASRADAAHIALYEQERDTGHAGAASADSSGEVIGPNTVGDPLLLAVYDVVLAILRQLSLASEVGDVASRIGLGDGKADALFARDQTRHDAVLEGLFGELDDRRAADAVTADHVPNETTGSDARQLVRDDHFVEQIPLLRRHRLHVVLSVFCGVVHTQQTGKIAAAAGLEEDLAGYFLLLIPLGDVGLNLVLNPFSDLGA